MMITFSKSFGKKRETRRRRGFRRDATQLLLLDDDGTTHRFCRPANELFFAGGGGGGGLGWSSRVYSLSNEEGGDLIKRYPVVFRVLKNPKHVACFPPLFFFHRELKFLLRETQKKKPPTSNGVLDVREETETGDRAGPVGAESRRCQFKRRRRRSTRQKSEGHKTAQY